MRRRTFLGTVGASLGVLTAGVPDTATAAEEIDPLAFDSTCSLLDANGQPITGEPDYVVATAESTAFNENTDGKEDGFVPYPDDESIPLVASAGGVIGIGAVFLQDGTGFEDAGNEEFVLNVLDAEADRGTGTVLWDEGHGQFFTTDKHLAFTDYANNNGYEIVGTDTLAADLPGADVSAAVVTTPPEAFTGAELDALATFVDDGGTLLLFSQSDFGGFNQPANLNEICEAVGAPFRFNDDQVNDFENNAGTFFVPTTDEFGAFPYFQDRPGLAPPELEVGRRYTVDVIDVADGDTVDVQFDNGYIDEVRLLGIDTPETFLPAELLQEWEGINDADFLATRGEIAADFAVDQLADETVEVFFDTEEPFRGGFGRLLMYLEYDADGDGARETLYNRRVIEDGYGRVFDSGLAKHDAFIDLERKAKRRGAGVWAESDVDASPPLADRPARVEKVFVPKAVPVTGTNAPGVEVLARASDTATQPEAPLAAVDERASVAVVGGQVIDEDYDEPDTQVENPAAYDDFQFTAGLVERLTNRAGEVLIDGGRGQFNEEEAVSAEDAAYFQRYLEGLDWRFTQYNDLSTRKLSRGRTLIVSSPAEGYTSEELAAIRRFKQGGGAVIVLDDRTGDRTQTNALLAQLGTSLRIGEGVVDDPETNAGEPFLPVAPVTGVTAPVYDDNEGEGRGNASVTDQGQRPLVGDAAD